MKIIPGVYENHPLDYLEPKPLVQRSPLNVVAFNKCVMVVFLYMKKEFIFNMNSLIFIVCETNVSILGEFLK